MDSAGYNHVLYYNAFSICSLMVRMSYACRGEAKDPNNEITIKEEQIDFGKREHLTEHFLCEVNKYGEVPTLVPVGDTPVPDSVDITLYLAKFYPTLMPGEYRDAIERLLKELHEINFFSLTFTGKPQMPLSNIQFLEERLQEPAGMSDRYRAAIHFKIQRIEKQKLAALAENEVENNINRTRAFLDKVKAILRDSETDWCFGLDGPSAFDAHLLIFIARLQDIQRDNLVPDEVKSWADKFMERNEWKNVMQERRTLPLPLYRSNKVFQSKV